jgi:hypothetical protein
MDIPSKEPFSFISGDLIKWTKTLSDYPASDSWALVYYLVKDGDQETITCTQYGSTDYHLATITAAESAAYSAGIYHYQARVTLVDEVYTIPGLAGQMEVLPNFEALTDGYDDRSHVKKTLDALEDLIYGKASLDQLSYTIAGRSLSRLSPSEVLEWRDVYLAEYAKEQRRAGLKKPQGIQVQFG